MNDRLTVYTDGSVSGRTGGWAWWTHDHLWRSGHDGDTTINQMELTAVVRALEDLSSERPGQPLLVVSDSAYVVNCFAEDWYTTWRRNGWKTRAGEPVQNRRLWERLLSVWEAYPVPVTFRHCRSHGKGGAADSDHVFGNDQADRLAVAARKLGRGGRPAGGGFA